MDSQIKSDIKVGFFVILAILISVLAIFGGVAGCKSWERGQARADANNKVQITHIEVRKQHEYAEIVEAQTKAVEAERHQRVVRAEGIEKAQRIIAKTLTPEYIQWEAIEAQKAIATSGNNNTVIYVPSGTNGVPTITQPATGKK